MSMIRTMVYLPEQLKRSIETEAARQNCSEAQVIREALERFLTDQPRPRPQGPVFHSPVQVAEHVDEYLTGFGISSEDVPSPTPTAAPARHLGSS